MEALLKTGVRFSLVRVASMAASLIEGLLFLHDLDIIHGDFNLHAVVVDAMVRQYWRHMFGWAVLCSAV